MGLFFIKQCKCGLLQTVLLFAGVTVGALLLASAEASASYSLTSSTFNVIGLDSNNPTSGPNRFPVGVKVCSTTAATNVDVALAWDSSNPYINLRSGSANPVTIPSIAAGGCADAYFEIEVVQDAAAYDTTRRYHISVPGASTPTPRELYVEHLISQSRNAIGGVKLNGVSIPAGGSMNLVTGNTYTIELDGGTATQGYNQFEAFIDFPNTIFQIQAVSTTYSANDSPYVTSPNAGMYADACRWENNPLLPTYLSCTGGDYKAGGSSVVTIYTVKIISGGGTSQILNTLLYDFSGSSFHYNADFTTGSRIANIVDPQAGVSIAKSFSPNTTAVNGVSTLVFTLSNTNATLVSGLTFTDLFPGDMKVAATPNATTSGCGSPTFSPSANDTALTFSNGTIGANSTCTVNVNITASTDSTTYTNTTGHLFVAGMDTGKTASASLTLNSSSFGSGTGFCGQTLAQWTGSIFSGSSSTAPDAKAANVGTAYFSAGNGLSFQADTSASGGNPQPGILTYGWPKNGPIVTSTFAYLQFAIDTSTSSQVKLRFDAQRKSNGPNNDALYYSTDGTTWTSKSTFSSTTTWTSYPSPSTYYDFTGQTSPSGVTYFRLYGYGANATSLGNDITFDNVAFTGCAAPVKATIMKAFSPGAIGVNGTSTLIFTLANANSSPLTGAGFSDSFPATPGHMTLVSTATLSTTCGGSLTDQYGSALSVGSTGIRLTNGTIPASGTCTVRADVTVDAAGPYSNVSGFLTTTEGGVNTNNVAAASLTAVLPPSITKQFAPNPILAGGNSTLTFHITNPNQSNTLSSVAFTDTLPNLGSGASGTMTVASAPTATTSGCGSPSFSPAAGSGLLSFSSGTIPPGATCSISVTVATSSTGTALYTNSTGSVSAAVAGAGNAATATLTVYPPHPEITILKQVASGPTGTWFDYLAVSSGSNIYFEFTVENDGDVPLASVAISDDQVNTSGCSWIDGDGSPLSAPFTLPVAIATNNKHYAVCVVGPVTAVNGYHVSTVTAYGTYNGTVYSDADWAIYATTGLSLAKKAAQSSFAKAGDVLNYQYEIMNNNAAPLPGPVTVSDNLTLVTCPSVSTVGNNDNYLDPYATTGEKITCTGQYTVQAADVTAKIVTNTASATMNGVTSATVSKSIPLAPDLVATAADNTSGQAIIGSSFVWTLTVNNLSSAGAASFSNGQVLLIDDLPASGATYTAPASATNAGGAAGTINCSLASATLTCIASGPVTIPAGGSFSMPVSVTTAATGTLTNPRSGGVCKVDPSNVLAEIDETNNTCGDSVAVSAAPNVTMTKSRVIVSDPFNGSTNPKAIPGAVIQYTIRIANAGVSALDANTIAVTDVVPANMDLCVSTKCSTPVISFSCSTSPACGLTFDPAANAAYSIQSNGGEPYSYPPPDTGDGYETSVRGVKLSPQGTMAGSGAYFDLIILMRVQ